jgi:hypothetical protein
MTPKDEPLTGPVGDVVAALGALRAAPAPEAGPALQALFSASAVVTAPPAVTTTRRSPVSTPKRLFASIPSKIAAGVVGALLAGSLGAGAMTGTIQLTSNEDEVSTEVVTEPAPAVEDTEAVVDDAPEADEVDDAAEDAADVEADGAAKEAGDPTTAPVPTSVSEAAHNHQFDEACGNHGAYVSHFARTGEEPECATTARTGEAVAPAADATATDLSATATASDDGDTTMTKSGNGGRGDAGKAKAAERKSAAKSKAKGKSGR